MCEVLSLFKIKRPKGKIARWFCLIVLQVLILGCSERNSKQKSIQEFKVGKDEQASAILQPDKPIEPGEFQILTPQDDGFDILQSSIEVKGVVIIKKSRKVTGKLEFRVYFPEYSYYGACKWEDIPSELIEKKFQEINTEKERLFVNLKCSLKIYKNYFAPRDFYTTGVIIFNSKDIKIFKGEYKTIKDWRNEYLEFKK